MSATNNHIDLIRNLPSFFEKYLKKGVALEDSSVLSVTKLLSNGQDLWTFFCSLVNFQIKIKKFLIPMLSGLAAIIKNKFNNDFYNFIFSDSDVQKQNLQNFEWYYINTKGKRVKKTKWEHRLISINNVLCILHIFKMFLLKYQSFESRTRELFFYAPGFKSFLEFFIENFHDSEFCNDCNKCISEDEIQNQFIKIFSKPKITHSSCLKRYLLFFRWMVRPAPDLQLWTFIKPSELYTPIDTTVKRVMGRIGVVKKDRDCVWSDVITITKFLREVDPIDPIKYDLLISRLGIYEICIKDIHKSNCKICPLSNICKVNKN